MDELIIEFQDISMKDDHGFCIEQTKWCDWELMGYEVLSERIPVVIASVAYHIFTYQFSLKDLPYRSTVINIANKGAEVVKKLHQKSRARESLGILKEGTMRAKDLVVASVFQYSSGDMIHGGYPIAADFFIGSCPPIYLRNVAVKG